MSVQVELHRHLDVCARTSTLYRLAQEKGLIPQSTSFESFSDQLIMRKPLADLSTVLGQFTLFQKVADRPEVLEQIAFETVEDCWNENTRVVEFRYSPSFVCEYNGLSWEESLAAYERGIARACKKYPDIKVGLLCIASRDYGTESVDKTIEFFLKYSSRFVGVDLAGSEKEYPAKLFESSFKKVTRAGLKTTIHAGEAVGVGPQGIWDSIEFLGAKRIGHGVASIHDPKLMAYLEKHQICLEMCPTSNWLTSAVPTFESHPLPKLLRAGVPVCINTDDPGIFGVTLPHEIEICRKKMGLSETEIRKCQENALKASFLS